MKLLRIFIWQPTLIQINSIIIRYFVFLLINIKTCQQIHIIPIHSISLCFSFFPFHEVSKPMRFYTRKKSLIFLGCAWSNWLRIWLYTKLISSSLFLGFSPFGMRIRVIGFSFFFNSMFEHIDFGFLFSLIFWRLF